MDYAQKTLVAIAAAFGATTWITTMCRVYVKTVISKSFGVDDYLAVMALVRARTLIEKWYKLT